MRQGAWDGAREYLEGTLQVHRERNNIGAVGFCWFTLGVLHLELGRQAEAEELLLGSLDICRRGGNVLFELWVLPVLAELYLDADKAAECIERGFELLTPGQNWCGLPAPLHLAHGMLARARQSWEEATRSFETALAINQRYGLPWDEATVLSEWGRMHLARGASREQADAREKLGAALAIFERIGARRDAEKTRAEIAKFGYSA